MAVWATECGFRLQGRNPKPSGRELKKNSKRPLDRFEFLRRQKERFRLLMTDQKTGLSET
ncbi:hypothetical protein EVA_13042 [gut metagenome]|uniref:Uncharacterized protein n=1 Tax=gut metagenome TaxID=749906 RepID=J9GAQ4_9ZZZZ